MQRSHRTAQLTDNALANGLGHNQTLRKLAMLSLDPDSLERLVPDEIVSGEATGQETLQLHLERYRFAAQHAREGRLLDIACGVGYGTALLAERTGIDAVGVDISPDAVRYATERYSGPHARFEQGNAMAFADPEGFDTIVSLETIEHVENPVGLLSHLVTLLKPQGVLICSVPTTPSVDLNPHHLHDFSEQSFRLLLGRVNLSELAALEQIQPVNPVSIARRKETRMRGMRQNLAAYYASHPRSLWRRVSSTLRHGFSNKYLTVVSCRREASCLR